MFETSNQSVQIHCPLCCGSGIFKGICQDCGGTGRKTSTMAEVQRLDPQYTSSRVFRDINTK